jgi:hypothetical protein
LSVTLTLALPLVILHVASSYDAYTVELDEKVFVHVGEPQFAELHQPTNTGFAIPLFVIEPTTSGFIKQD